MGSKTGKKVRGLNFGWMDKYVEQFLYENKNQGLLFSSFTDLSRYAFYMLLRKFPGYEEMARLYEADMEMVPGEVYQRRIAEVVKKESRENEKRNRS